MVVNKHGSFYMRSGWGTKIIRAVEEDDMIFTPNSEQQAIDNIGLGRVMIKALRYWSEAMQLTSEEKTQAGIRLIPEAIYNDVRTYDMYFQRQGSLLLMHRNLALNIDNATAWYWIFNRYSRYWQIHKPSYKIQCFCLFFLIISKPSCARYR